MNIVILRTFLEVIDAGNLNKAAERLHVTQSTVTSRMNGLEEHFGQKLLVRSKAGAELTSAGFKFVRYAEMMLQVWEQAHHEVGLPQGFESACNIGCHLDLWEGLGQAWLDEMRRAHPRVALSLWPGDPAQVDKWLGTGMIDLAFVTRTQMREDCTVRTLFEETLVLVSTRKRPLMRWDPEYIYVDMGTEFRRWHATTYPVNETAAVTFGSSSWALDHMFKWGGSGYLPLRSAEAHLRSGALHRVEGAPDFARTAYLVYKTRAASNWPWFESFLQAFQEHLEPDS